MDEDSLAYLDKAIESLVGAESEYADRRYNNCANRCYYAMFQCSYRRTDRRWHSHERMQQVATVNTSFASQSTLDVPGHGGGSVYSFLISASCRICA